jgi:sugar lactone lactonase YvrE
MTNKNSGPLCIAPTADRCGEGVVWHAAQSTVYWTDINRFIIHGFSLADRGVRSWFFEEPATAIVLTDRDDTLAVVLASGVILWQPSQDTRRPFGFQLDGYPKVRLNDARVDPQGSLWAGTMRNNVNPDGSSGEAGGLDGVLYRIDGNKAVSTHRMNIGVSNTLAWSPDRKHFYFADSLANVIWSYDYDEASRTISNEKSFFEGYSRGLPDGSTMDAEGFLWNCRYGGNCVVRVAPDGKIDRVIEMPTPNITTCTFGGADHSTLYITTAAAGAPPGDRVAGSLFALQPGVKGQPENRFKVFGNN